MWNIIGVQNWDKATIRVALLAHWDTRPTADQETDPDKRAMPIPGADDGASGVAVLLELARAMKVSPAKVGVMYVLLDGEDLGPGLDEMFLGARGNGGQPAPAQSRLRHSPRHDRQPRGRRSPRAEQRSLRSIA